MERATALERLFGDSVIVRVLDFLTLARNFDYHKAEIAEHAGVDATSITRVWPALEKLAIVKPTRTIQRAVMYRLNKESSIVQSLTELSDRIASFRAREGLKKRIIAKAGRQKRSYDGSI